MLLIHLCTLKLHQVSWKQLLTMQIWNICRGRPKMHVPCMNRPLQLKKEKKNILRPCHNFLLNTLDFFIWFAGRQEKQGKFWSKHSKFANYQNGRKALYQDADIYLLDDPFSAVDAHTGSELFKVWQARL
ncbi:hypothetical protein ACET3Z_010273 [Daucus carota]